MKSRILFKFFQYLNMISLAFEYSASLAKMGPRILFNKHIWLLNVLLISQFLSVTNYNTAHCPIPFYKIPKHRVTLFQIIFVFILDTFHHQSLFRFTFSHGFAIILVYSPSLLPLDDLGYS